MLTVVVLFLITRIVRLSIPVWKATRQLFLGINSDKYENDNVILHYICPHKELRCMQRSTMYLCKTFVNKRVETADGLHRLGAFPTIHPICVVAKTEGTGEIQVMLRGRRFVEEDELCTSWKQTKIQIEGNEFMAFTGFVKVFREIEHDVKRLLIKHTGNIHIVGHSLGSGVGVFLAISLHLIYPHRIRSVTLLANTRVATPALSKYIEQHHPTLWSRIWRVVNECDPICHMPLPYMPSLQPPGHTIAYAHIGRCVLLFQSICHNMNRGHHVETYQRAIGAAISASALAS